MSENTREDLQEHVLTAVRKSQEMTLATVKKVVETLSAATAKLPANPLEGKLHDLPLAAKLHELPAPGTVVSSTFDFAGRLLAEQRTFAEELVKATAPLRPRAKDAADVPETTETPATPQTPETPAA
ncbi:MAG TPA: hypothetical protein VN714_34550 [Trebonia sp.]|jgi:hypothetical protein|nr:hypothetical protein [Trebonia sp.]